MKSLFTRLLPLWAALLLLAACSADEEPAPPAPAAATLRVSTAPLRIEGEAVPFGTRADSPLPPETENYINTLSILVFDGTEGVLRPFRATSALEETKYYRFLSLRDAEGNGLLNTTLTIDEHFPIVDGKKYTICLIANFTEAQTDSIVRSMMADGTAFLQEFKEATIAIPYQLDEASGLVSDIYMFGYYDGIVTRGQDINITLGRIISRLELSFTVDESALSSLRPDYGFFCRMVNLELTARLFPTGVSPKVMFDYPVTVMPSLNAAADGRAYIYLYVAPNSAQTADEALRLDMWYAPLDSDPAALADTEPHATIYLSNDSPEVTDRNYRLNRNSLYRFHINLTNQ